MIDPIAAPGAFTPAATVQPQPSPADPSAPCSVSDRPGGETPSTAARAPDVPAPVARAYVDRSASGVYVYRLVDVDTGRVLVELPRADSEALKVTSAYAPGAAACRSA